jgi:hypothetical protein
MVDWEITATTIYCEAVDDEVTLLAHKDGTVKCTGRAKYSSTAKETAKELKKKSKQLGKPLSCSGDDCTRVTEYRNKLLGEQ